MADKAITGINADLTINGSQLCHALGWTLNPLANFVGYNSNCTGAAIEKVTTTKDWNGTMDVATEKGKCLPFEEGDTITGVWNTSTVAGEGCTYSGSALITNIGVAVTINGASDLVTHAITFEGSGVLSRVDNP